LYVCVLLYGNQVIKLCYTCHCSEIQSASKPAGGNAEVHT